MMAECRLAGKQDGPDLARCHQDSASVHMPFTRRTLARSLWLPTPIRHAVFTLCSSQIRPGVYRWIYRTDGAARVHSRTVGVQERNPMVLIEKRYQGRGAAMVRRR